MAEFVHAQPTGKPPAHSATQAVKRLVWAAVIVVAAVIVFNLITFTVGEGEQAVVSRFGVIQRVIVSPDNDFIQRNPDLLNSSGSKLHGVAVVQGKGLFVRVPFIDQVQKYDARLITYVSNPETVNTADKKQYVITMFAQWRIANPGLFMVTHRERSRAGVYLDNLIYPVIVQSINKLDADHFLSDKEALNASLDEALAAINASVRDGGLEIVGIQVNRTILPPANLQSTYDRMIANRQKEAQRLRAEGAEEYENAVSETDLQASIIAAEAHTQSRQIMGEADAHALEIYADAYSHDSAFYGYWRSLQALRQSLTHNATIVLGNDHPLWRDLLAMVQTGELAADTLE